MNINIFEINTFNIIKKNRKYFAATTKNGYNCKILIDQNSEGLELGENNLTVDDISVRSKYGTDLIFKLSASVDEQKNAGICTLQTAFYNKILVDECHKLGGMWDADEKAWIFPDFVSDEVELLDEKYNSKMINIEMSFDDDYKGFAEAIYIAGFKIAQAFSRDSGSKAADGIAFIAGGTTSGGSIKNWKTSIREGSIIRMSMPELCLADIDDCIAVKKI